MNLKHAIPMLFALAFAAGAVACSDPCGDLNKQKADCAKAPTGVVDQKAMCEMGVDTVVKAGNKDACKAAIDNKMVESLTKH